MEDGSVRIFWQFRVKGFASRGWELERDFDGVPGGRQRIWEAFRYFLAVY